MEVQVHVYFYSFTSPSCAPQVKNCYCDELCYLERHMDCCLNCWAPETLSCGYFDRIRNRFRHCEQDVSSYEALDYFKDLRFVDDPTAINEPCWQPENYQVLED